MGEYIMIELLIPYKDEYKTTYIDDDMWWDVAFENIYYQSNSKRFHIKNKKKKQDLGRYILELKYTSIPKGKVVDHINGDGTNNTSNNLRILTQQLNTFNRRKAQSNNTNGYLGVYYDKNCNKYKAEIMRDGKQYRLGNYYTAEEAHEAYINAKIEKHQLDLDYWNNKLKEVKVKILKNKISDLQEDITPVIQLIANDELETNIGIITLLSLDTEKEIFENEVKRLSNDK